MNKRTLAIARATAVIGGTGALIIGATFAATPVGTVDLTGNTFAAIQGIQISNGGAFSDSVSGFNFGNTPIGNTGSAVKNFYLEDTTGGASALSVSVAAANCGAFTGLDTTKVHVNIKKNGGSTTDTGTLSDLCGSTPLDLTNPDNSPTVGGASTKYDVWLTADNGAISGVTNPASDGFDLAFTGNQ
jgi:hypothetical protein